jgi:hypothetical protein
MRNATPFSLYRAMPWAVALGALALGMPSHAQWKWRDKDGTITVSDRPPPRDVADKDILGRPTVTRRVTVPPATPASTASAPFEAKGPLDRELEARRRAADQEQAAKSKADEVRLNAQRGENCLRARTQVATLESGQRMARVNAKGEREVLDDKARAEELAQARDAAAANCR